MIWFALGQGASPAYSPPPPRLCIIDTIDVKPRSIATKVTAKALYVVVPGSPADNAAGQHVPGCYKAGIKQGVLIARRADRKAPMVDIAESGAIWQKRTDAPL